MEFIIFKKMKKLMQSHWVPRIFNTIVILAIIMMIIVTAKVFKHTDDFGDSYHKVVNVYTTKIRTATGFFVDDDLVMTCAHVLDNMDPESKIYIEFIAEKNGTKYITRRASLVSCDFFSDLCLLRVDKLGFKPRRFDISARKPTSGASVYTIGNALNLDSLSFCRGDIRDGNWCNDARMLNVCLTSIPSYQGQSGAPILVDGKVVAINSISYGEHGENDGSDLSGGPSCRHIQYFLDTYKQRTNDSNKRYQMVQSVPDLRVLRLTTLSIMGTGLLIDVLTESDSMNGLLVSAEAGGLLLDDIITHVNGTPVSTDHNHMSIGDILWKLDKGSIIDFSIIRKSMNINVVLETTYNDSIKTIGIGRDTDFGGTTLRTLDDGTFYVYFYPSTDQFETAENFLEFKPAMTKGQLEAYESRLQSLVDTRLKMKWYPKVWPVDGFEHEIVLSSDYTSITSAIFAQMERDHRIRDKWGTHANFEELLTNLRTNVDMKMTYKDMFGGSPTLNNYKGTVKLIDYVKQNCTSYAINAREILSDFTLHPPGGPHMTGTSEVKFIAHLMEQDAYSTIEKIKANFTLPELIYYRLITIKDALMTYKYPEAEMQAFLNLDTNDTQVYLVNKYYQDSYFTFSGTKKELWTTITKDPSIAWWT
jgi:S1-C subfamily serine protease